jgi:hypothetical protein
LKQSAGFGYWQVLQEQRELWNSGESMEDGACEDLAQGRTLEYAKGASTSNFPEVSGSPFPQDLRGSLKGRLEGLIASGQGKQRQKSSFLEYSNKNAWK